MELDLHGAGALHLACAVALAVVALIAALTRGDRVMRLGVIGAACTALPWVAASALAASVDDPGLATRILRLGAGPLALVGPSLLLILLGAAGQLERYRWVARGAGCCGAALTGICWGTPAVVAGVRELPTGLHVPTPGSLTGLHLAQLGAWLIVGAALARGSLTWRARRRLLRPLLGVLALSALAATDILIVYGVTSREPIAPMCVLAAAGVAVWLELRTSLLGARGLDRAALLEVGALAGTLAVVGALLVVTGAAAPLSIAAGAAGVWSVALALAWARARAAPARAAGEHAIDRFAAAVAELEHAPTLAARLSALWHTLEVDLIALLRAEGDELVDVTTGARGPLDASVAAWLVARSLDGAARELVAAPDLATLRLGPVRPALEGLLGEAGLVVPLVDRGALLGIALAAHAAPLRERERAVLADSAQAAARALVYADLARVAARERETAREVEVAEAMRSRAAASGGEELGPWSIAAAYRAAARSTGASWSASLLPAGRLAVMVTEAEAHGVPAALATAALTGAFAAATAGEPPADLDALLASLLASSEGVVRAGAPVAAFVAILDPAAGALAWACSGHPGGVLITGDGDARTLLPLGGGDAQPGASLAVATRGVAPLRADALLLVASSATQGDDRERWLAASGQAAAAPRLVSRLVDPAARPALALADADLLAVAVCQRDRDGGAGAAAPPR